MIKLFIFCKNANNIQKFQIISYEIKKIVKCNQETIKSRTPSLWEDLTEE